MGKKCLLGEPQFTHLENDDSITLGHRGKG